MTLTDVDGNDWGKLHSGKLSWDQIEEAIKDPTWQYARKAMKGKPMTSKWRLCQDYLRIKANSKLAQVAVTNYVNALKRAGLVFERIS